MYVCYMDVSIFYLCTLCVCVCVCMCYMDMSLVISVLCVCVTRMCLLLFLYSVCVLHRCVSYYFCTLCVLHMWYTYVCMYTYTHCMNNCRGQSLASGYLPQLLFHLAVLLLLCGKFEGHLFVLKWDLSLNQKLTIS